MYICKKNNSLENWSVSKLTAAISKSAERVKIDISDEQTKEICNDVLKKALKTAYHDGTKQIIHVKTLHEIVINTLNERAPAVGQSYLQYRDYKKLQADSFRKVFTEADRVLHAGDRENANFDSTLTSTKSSLMRGVLTGEIYRNHILGKDYLKEIDHGFLYIHDIRDLIFNSINCCLFDMGRVLKGGFTMSNQHYTEPKDVFTALSVIGDVMLTSTAQQFGGFTIPDIDAVLLPYIKKTRKTLRDELSYAKSLSHTDCDLLIERAVRKQLRQGFQSIEMKMNTVPSGRGDFAFTTLSFGNIDRGTNKEKKDRKMICDALLDVRIKGTGNNQPVTFPKLVFLFNRHEYETSPAYAELFDHSVECSSKCMYPDYLSVDNKDSYVGQMYRKHGVVVSPMGCRAYLSEDESGTFTGRANIGAVSLNLPMIWQKSKGENFYKDLEFYMQMIRKFLIKRYHDIANNYCSSNPMAFTQGGLKGGTKNPTDKIGLDIVKSFTASFGISALNELNYLAEGKPLHESDGKFMHEVLDFINGRIKEFKKEDGFLYALYGTPAESLCGTQMKQFKKMFGEVKNVTDKDYFSNSFHMHVTAEITPFEKQDLEHSFFHKCLGGHIQYVRLTNTSNLEAIKAIILRGMDMGFYQGVNFDLVICESCGHRPKTDVELCPCCGSHKIMIISRVCGYIGYLKSGGETRFNDSKVAEVLDRKSM
ncbi:anaerobic ribonucleoside-triphosphate reductase [Photobacterium kishitanii]|uniref:Anaerobic ribonucleoside-triphosphate reductase n=1 Tax=Photobacterium kishitanii TaxID=318456 RepID=A0A2T3KMG6_9GAMM|nr:anaerobic ribonucleoside-triphosphate reductase [Photobacterium kishitanii]PSV00972.1 anaerobic ribonucleoside-triphosphate reductase [Photobacterium kishitanii]